MQTNINTPPKNWDRRGLPTWTYKSQGLFDIELKKIFRTHWQLVCHQSDIPDRGSYSTFDVGGDRALIIRGNDDKIRAFHNLCRHRGSRVVSAPNGRCKHAITCPFHGWSYNLDGSLRGVSRPQYLPNLNKQDWGLKAIETEIWNGFIFIRFEKSQQPSVNDLLGRFSELVAPYQLEKLTGTGGVFVFADVAANWKSMRDVDNEGYHVATAHPSLHELYGKNYYDEPYENGTSLSVGKFNKSSPSGWSVSLYKKLVAQLNYLPDPQSSAWYYIGIFPNTVIGLYPDSVIFYQDIPVGLKQTKQRGAVYKHNNESRQMRAARYLSGRIDGLTADEDLQLTKWVDEAPDSSGFEETILSDLEYGVYTYHNHLRQILPVIGEEREPRILTKTEKS